MIRDNREVGKVVVDMLDNEKLVEILIKIEDGKGVVITPKYIY